MTTQPKQTRLTCLTCKFYTSDNSDFPCLNCDNGARQPPVQSYWCAPDLIGAMNGYESHYHSAHQPLEVLQANRPKEEFIGFLLGNLLKYVCRFGKKGDTATEAKKILRYAEWLQKAVAGETIDPRK